MRRPGGSAVLWVILICAVILVVSTAIMMLVSGPSNCHDLGGVYIDQHCMVAKKN